MFGSAIFFLSSQVVNYDLKKKKKITQQFSVVPNVVW